MLPPPEHPQPGARCSDQDAEKGHRLPQPLPQRAVGLGHIHARHQDPGRIRDSLRGANHRLTAVVQPFHHAALPQHGFHRQDIRISQGDAQVERCIRPEAERAQEEDMIALATHQQRLGGRAGSGPSLEVRIQAGLRIDAQDDDAYRSLVVLACIQGHEEGKMNGPLARLLMEIEKGDLARSQGGCGIMSQMCSRQLACLRDGKSLDAPSI